ncbi:MAG: PHP domain-containing protein [Nanoarchaeota archaeon]|nr:PHP domain-containing protein [Nanoarchaeota archaeon]MBU1005588.1 PHP domain-containing protein [Nanoarchaeota archaeon]MBU1945974.1 PHP domain-containing protein [Nanoarchaeota archaeon]
MAQLKKYVDLHIHTDASDGALSAKGTVRKAIEHGLSAIAITDHDSIDNVAIAVKEGKNHGLLIVPGVELTVDDYRNNIIDIHILGLFIDIHNKPLNQLLMISKKERFNQKKCIINKLQALGYKINFEEVRETAKGEIGRLHIAHVLLKRNKQLKNLGYIFEHLLGVGKPAYARRKHETGLKEAISAIHSAGGIAVLAHPYLYDSDFDNLIKKFVETGGDGLEVFYAYDKTAKFEKKPKNYLDNLQSRLKKIALKNNLSMSGGSDFHGHARNKRIGYPKIPLEVVEQMKRMPINKRI